MSSTFNELNFAVLASQSNIYGLSWFRTLDSETAKLLVASIKKPIVCFEFNNKPAEALTPSSKEVHFTYVPGGAEIISIDNFNRSSTSNDFTIGITFSKEKSGDSQSTAYYLNIYREWEPQLNFNLDSISQSCLSLELKFIPYKLYHTQLFDGNSKEIVWLLSGNDANVHLFREEKGRTYTEVNIDEYFPEFLDLPSTALCMDILNIKESSLRLTAFGCEDGYVRACTIDTTSNKLVKSWSIKHDSPISCVKLFKVKSDLKPPTFIKCSNRESSRSQRPEEDYNLLVVSTLEVTVIYWRFVSEGMNEQATLPYSDFFDCVQCACIADIDFDGYNEIIIGTYGQQLLMYKCVETRDTPPTNKSDSASTPTSIKFHYSFVLQRRFAHPLLAVEYFDVTGDGLKELVVLSTKGLHVLQHKLDEVCDKIAKRLEKLLSSNNKNAEERSHV
ncbi:hypothetical protein CHUAL_009726 [Chamberlinius hualienensis]